jgi:hypothetical protein
MQCVKSAKDKKYVPVSATFRDRVVLAVLLVVVGPVGPTTTNSTAITTL